MKMKKKILLWIIGIIIWIGLLIGTGLLIDCGLFQGLKNLRLRNWASFPVAAQKIDAVLLTHAHLDHSGYLPRLLREGFKGPIFSTAPTLDLLKIMLPDSAKLQEEEAYHARKHGYSKHKKPQPLYTMKDAERCYRLFSPVEWNHRTKLPGGFQAELHRAGHILSITVRVLLLDFSVLSSKNRCGAFNVR